MLGGGCRQGHGQITDHFHSRRGEIQVAATNGCTMSGKEVGEANDEHDRGILHIDDEVVADLRHDIPQRLGQNHIGHGLHMGHTDGFRTLCLTGINGDNAAADRLGHVCTGVDGNDQNGSNPEAFKAYGIVGEVRKAVVEENCLQHHGRTAEHFHIYTDNRTNQTEEKTLDRRVVFAAGNGIENTADKTDDAANNRSDQGQHQRIEHTAEILITVLGPKLDNITGELRKLGHKPTPSILDYL